MVTVVSYSHRGSDTMWKCICDCGKEFITRGCRLKDGSTKSCGCWHKRKMVTHGCSKRGQMTLEFRAWREMKNRCKGYCEHTKKYYKDKGITVCERWKKFENFLEDMGYRPSPKHSIDRIDNSKGYFKENCRWATKKEQANNMTSNCVLTYMGNSMTISQWSEKTGLKPGTLWNRLNISKWSVEKTLSTPLIPNNASRTRKPSL